MQHLIDASPYEWENFKKKEADSEKAKDWVQRMEKDILQGISLEKKRKKQEWVHDTVEGQKLKKRLIEWASIRFQALYRTVNGFMQAPRALEILARIQEPSLSQEDAQELVKKKFSYLIGYQSYARSEKEFIKSKDKAINGVNLTPSEIEAHDAVFNIAFLKEKFPELRIAYPDFDKGKHIGRMNYGNKTDTFQEFTIELFGPFGDMGLGKPTHQNFLSQFIDGLAIQTIDINQDSVISQSFFIPNVLAEFDADPAVRIIGLPEFIITTNWSGTAWFVILLFVSIYYRRCAAFGEKTFGTLVQRTYARLGLRLHYG